jgi:hypothetical protein
MAAMAQPEIAGVIELRRNRAMVSSVKIAELFERRHDSVLRAIRKVQNRHNDLRIGAEMSPDERGRDRPVFWLDERAALVVMPFIGGQHAMAGQRRLVDAYLWYRDHYANPPRADILAEKRAAHHPMMDALIESREEQGKATRSVHYMSENKLCNAIVRGRYVAIDERELSNEEASLLAKVRRRNEALLLAGLDYQTRKARLVAYVTRERTKLFAMPSEAA